ncbi:PBP1A family penicillin-binding protein [Lactococcus termiticola]|uniref:PBP1A family penicillin-binding protein n=1 Tax=Lactococcus termiticola TaxID=2169526 RepID=UPI001CECCD5A|nr:PBP1A family penicillin-binding protein [Lactococcus termiticola]
MINKESNPVKYYASKVWRPFRRFWKKYSLTKVSLIALIVLVVATGSYLFYLAKSANVSVLQSSISAQTEIIDKNGNVAGELYGSKGSSVEFNQISDNVKNAVVATEDRTFYKNHGVNLGRFILATVTLGRFGGGSTITQQLAKNAYLTQAQTIDRKAREFFLALEINKHYSKQQILTMYLNNSYFGNGVWGIQDASEKYFGIPASDLTVDEAATLAGMLKGPEIYNPLYKNAQYAVPRRNTVLQNMVNAGFLKQDEADGYAKVDLLSELKDNYVPQTKSYKYPSYFNAVITEAENKFGMTLQEIMNNGYKIYTSLDSNMQTGMQATYSNVSLFPQAADGTYAQSGSVAIDPKTGGVSALVGNVDTGDYNAFLNFNYATQSKRSTGSTIKPLIAYLPAVQSGWSTDKVLSDVGKNFGSSSNPYEPKDDDGMTGHTGQYDGTNYASGTLPMYQALANSYNIPALNTYQSIGPEKGNELGKTFGLNLTDKNNILPTVLGSGVETNPWQMAQAYATFANGGVMNTAHIINKVENAAGQTIHKAKVSQTRVMSESDADKMTSMMQGTFTNGSAWNAAPSSYAMAGKTGTNNTTDQWVIGYTPDIAIALWVGFPQESNAQYQLEGTSSGQTSVIFRDEASYILPYTPGTKFNSENAYAAHGISPLAADWTQTRQNQDNIVATEQYKNNTTGNAPVQSSGSNSSDSSSNDSKLGEKIKKGLNDVGNAAKDLWDKASNIFN